MWGEGRITGQSEQLSSGPQESKNPDIGCESGGLWGYV